MDIESSSWKTLALWMTWLLSSFICTAEFPLFSFIISRSLSRTAVISFLTISFIMKIWVIFYINLCNSTASLGVDFCRNYFNPKNEEMNNTIFHDKVKETTNSYLENAIKTGLVISNGRTAYEVSNDLCVISKGIFFDWSANEGRYDISKYIDGLLRRCLKGIL